MTIELLRDETRPYGEYIQPVGAKLLYSVDWTERITRFWRAGTPFDAGVTVRTVKSPGWQFVSSGGFTGGVEPLWPGAFANPLTPQAGQTVVDGSIIWAAQQIDSTCLLTTVQSAQWQADTGISVATSAVLGNEAVALVDTTGSTDGADYYLRNFTTLGDGTVEPAIFLIRVRNQNA